LLQSSLFLRLLGEKGVNALERLMGLVLVMLATQMFLDIRLWMNMKRQKAKGKQLPFLVFSPLPVEVKAKRQPWLPFLVTLLPLPVGRGW
jgi:hypothetical protein